MYLQVLLVYIQKNNPTGKKILHAPLEQKKPYETPFDSFEMHYGSIGILGFVEIFLCASLVEFSSNIFS